MLGIRRREFISLLGGAAAWPLAVRAQQRLPVIGFLNGVSFSSYGTQVAHILQGLRQTGFFEGQNVVIEYRSAEGQYNRLPALAAELARQRVTTIIAVGSTNSALSAKEATSTIPIVFITGTDPVATGLVTNLRRPEANLTGVTLNSTALAPKRLEIIRDLLPGKKSVGYLRNPTNPFDTDMSDLRGAAAALGLEISVFEANSDRDLLSVFDSMAKQRIAALTLSTDVTFIVRRNQIAALAAHHGIPTIYQARDFVEVGGLISYGPERSSLYRQTGIYAGRILKGEKPADLPVMQPTSFELVINMKTAKALGLDVSAQLLARADEVIE